MSDEKLARLSDEERARLLYLLLLERLGPDRLRLTLAYLDRRRVEAAETTRADEAAAVEDLRSVLAEAAAYRERLGGEQAGGFLRDLSAALARVVLGIDIPASRRGRADDG
jgi:hypothetical protein